MFPEPGDDLFRIGRLNYKPDVAARLCCWGPRLVVYVLLGRSIETDRLQPH
jgi:hypothetical protein